MSEEEEMLYQYRVWDSIDHKWADMKDYCLLSNGKLGCISTFGELVEVRGNWPIIELATGEQDSKGHMIFEGDIIFQETWTINHMGNKVLSYLTYIEVRFPRFWCDVLEWLSGESYTLIGNIHENPDLLEKKR